MGINNQDGSLYWATGIDNTGLIADKQKTLGLIRGMAKQISGFDVFAGLSASAAIAFSRVAKDAKRMSVEYKQAMKEVQTISAAVAEDYEGFANQIVELSTRVPQSAKELAKAYYQIVSAGYDGAEGMALLESSARGAIGGVTDVTTAADGMTTVLNAWKISAEESGRVADVFFNTVKMGKTTFGELASNIAKVAPLAAAYGVSFEEISAATATLTKQGTPTAEAMTQIRQALIAANETLGEGWRNTYNLQEAFIEMSKRAKESGDDLKTYTGRVEGALAILGMTGINAKMAAEDLKSFAEALGISEKAFRTMMESSVNQSQLLRNNIDAALKPIGDFLSQKSTDFAKFMNESFESGKIEEWAKQLGKAVVMIAAFTAGMKSGAIAIKAYNIAVNGTAKAFKSLFLAIRANPIGIIIGSLAALAVALRNTRNEADRFAKLYEGIDERVRGMHEEEITELGKLQVQLDLAKQSKSDYKDIIETLDSKYSTHLGNLDDEADKYKAIKEEIDKLIASMETKIDLEILEEQARTLREEMNEMKQNWADVIEGFEGEVPTKSMEEEMNKRAKEILNEMYGGWQNVPVNAMQKNRWEQLREILKEELKNYTGEYDKVIKQIREKQKELLEIDSGNEDGGKKGGGGDGGEQLNYYEDLEQKIKNTKDQLKNLADEQGSMNQQAIEQKKQLLRYYEAEKQYLDIILGLSRDTWEEQYNQMLEKQSQDLDKRIVDHLDIEIEIDEESFDKVEKYVRLLGKIVKESSLEDFKDDTYDVADAFYVLGNFVNGFNEQLGKGFQVASNVAAEVGRMAASVASGNVLASAASFFSIFSQIFTLFTDQAAAIDQYKIRMTELNDAIEDQQRLLEQSTRTGGAAGIYEEIIKKEKEKLEVLKNQLQNYQNQLKIFNSFTKFQRMLSGIPESTADGYKAIIKDIEGNIKDQENAISDLKQDYKDFFAGLVTEIDLADKIAQAFQEGKTAAADFGEYMEEVMRDATLEVFKANILSEQLTEAQEFLSDSLEDTRLSKAEIITFQNLMQQVVENSADVWDDLNSAIDEVFGDSEKNQNSLTGAIRAQLTEETGSLLAGRMNTMMLDLRKLVDIALAAVDHLQAIEQNTRYNKKLESIDNRIGNLADSLTNIEA